MLKIVNNLVPFFEDCYKEINVREYSRIMKISPPTASKFLKQFNSDELLKKRLDRKYLLFRSNRESFVLRDLSRIYWKNKLWKLIEHIKSEYHEPTIILFGSLSKLEVKEESDIDIVIITKIKKKINIDKFEKLYKKDIQLFTFSSFDKINKELRNSVLNGYVLNGKLG